MEEYRQVVVERLRKLVDEVEAGNLDLIGCEESMDYDEVGTVSKVFVPTSYNISYRFKVNKRHGPSGMAVGSKPT